MIGQTCYGWAICSDSAGILQYTTSRTRAEAIEKFMLMIEGPLWEDRQWRRSKAKGWRSSRVEIRELTFGKGSAP